MMREIKFRLIKDNKVVGYEWHDAENYSDVTICHSEDGEEWFAIEYCVVERRFIEHDHKDQYTSLKDKNGVEIYEADIIQSVYTHNRKNAQFVIEWECSGDDIYEWTGYPYGHSVGRQFCIIGNIHENKDLLG